VNCIDIAPRACRGKLPRKLGPVRRLSTHDVVAHPPATDSTEVESMSAERTEMRAALGWTVLLAVCLVAGLAALTAAREASAAVGPLPIAGVAETVDGTVDVGPGVAVIVCHVGVGAEALGIPVVIQASEIGAFLASNPHDSVGACRSPAGGASSSEPATGLAVPGQTVVQAGLLAGLGDSVIVAVCATGDGQLFLTPDAAAAIVRADSGVTFGSCAARGDGGGSVAREGGSGNPSTAEQGALFLDGRGVSVPASSLACGDRLIVTRVATTPRVVRTAKARVTARFVVVNDKGLLVRGASVRLRSTPLGYVHALPKGTTKTDGSVRFSLTTTNRLPLRAGGRLVLFVRATLPGRPLIGCVTGRRLISLRVSAPRT
jgi:hypothetical protein